MKKVIIVREGAYGDLSSAKGDYDLLIGLLQRNIETAETEGLSGRKEKAADVQVVETFTDAVQIIKRERISVLVFISRGMVFEAKKIKKEHPRVKVIVFTGDIPDDEIIFVDKGWLLSFRDLQNIILH